MKKSYIQDPKTGKLVLKSEYIPPSRGVMIQEDIEPFVSPITKEVITSRSQLRIHNKEQGVTDSRDYSPEFMEKKVRAREDELVGNTPQAHEERIECVKRTMKEFGIW